MTIRGFEIPSLKKPGDVLVPPIAAPWVKRKGGFPEPSWLVPFSQARPRDGFQPESLASPHAVVVRKAFEALAEE